MISIVSLETLAVLVYDQHTFALILDRVTTASDVLCPSWSISFMGVLTDRERKMTGRVSGLAISFSAVTLPGFVLVWCGVHSFDICLQSLHCILGSKDFYHQRTALILYLPT